MPAGPPALRRSTAALPRQVRAQRLPASTSNKRISARRGGESMRRRAGGLVKASSRCWRGLPSCPIARMLPKAERASTCSAPAAQWRGSRPRRASTIRMTFTIIGTRRRRRRPGTRWTARRQSPNRSMGFAEGPCGKQRDIQIDCRTRGVRRGRCEGAVSSEVLGSFTCFKDSSSCLYEVSVHLLEVRSISPQFPEKDVRKTKWFLLREAIEQAGRPGLKALLLRFDEQQERRNLVVRIPPRRYDF